MMARSGLLDDAAQLLPELVALRRDLHATPEVGLDLPRTQQRIAEALADAPLDLRQGTGSTSLYGVLRGRMPGPTVLLRADMDALPVREDSGEDFASTNGAMHACGHDLHMAGLVGAVRLLATRLDVLAGNVLVAFQPGEEGHDGAQRMLDEGLLDAAPTPVAAAYALHVGAGRTGTVWTRPGPILASLSLLRITLQGGGGHDSAPHLARDPVRALVDLAGALPGLVDRTADALDPVVVSVTRLHAGTADNVVPENAWLGGTLRALSGSARDSVHAEITRSAALLAAAHGLDADVQVDNRYPVTVNDQAETQHALQVATELIGRDDVDGLHPPLMGSEDFSKILAKVPGTLLFVGATPPGLDPATAPAMHSPRARFDDNALATQSALLSALALARLGQ